MSRKSSRSAGLDFRGSSKNYKNRRFFIFRENNGKKLLTADCGLLIADCPPACLNCRTAGRDDSGRPGRLIIYETMFLFSLNKSIAF